MKWRHSKHEAKQDKNRTTKIEIKEEDDDMDCGSSIESDSCGSSDDNEIDIEAE